MPPVIDLDKCTRCGTCDKNCPIDVFFLSDKNKIQIRYPEECWHCGSCRQDCPEKAIRIVFPPDMVS